MQNLATNYFHEFHTLLVDLGGSVIREKVKLLLRLLDFVGLQTRSSADSPGVQLTHSDLQRREFNMDLVGQLLEQ